MSKERHYRFHKYIAAMSPDCLRNRRHVPSRRKAMCPRNPFLPIAILCIVTGTGCTRHQARVPADAASILLFNGRGTAREDVAALEDLLKSKRLEYATANSSELNQMPAPQLEKSRLLIVPGGNFVEIGNGLTPEATANIHDAVHHGLNYLGICAGAFFAGDLSGHNSLNLTWGVRFRFYSLEDKGIRKAAIAIAVAGAPTRDQYWEDGPQFTGWGDVIGKYPDGTPAIVEGAFGSGWVILTGVHPEAPEHWQRGLNFALPAGVNTEFAGTLVRAALNRESLPHY